MQTSLFCTRVQGSLGGGRQHRGKEKASALEALGVAGGGEASKQDSQCELLRVRVHGTWSKSPQRNQNNFAGEKYKTRVPCPSSLSAELLLGDLKDGRDIH